MDEDIRCLASRHYLSRIHAMQTETEMLREELTHTRAKLNQAVDLLEAAKAEKRLPKNMDFVQVSRSEMRAIAELGAKSSLSLEILMMLAQVMNKENAVMMSYETMESLTNKSKRQLSRAISLLKAEHWIQVVKVGTANAYVLNNAVFWTDRGDKKYATFSAKVVTTLDEQDKDLRRSPAVKLQRVPSLQASERLALGDEELPPPDQIDLNLL